MKYALNFFLILTVLVLFISGCATAPKRGQLSDGPELAQVIVQAVPPKVVTNNPDKTEYKFRRKPVIINFKVYFDDDFGRYVFDFDHFEQLGLKWGESVIWECERPFTVYIGWDSLFKKGVYTGEDPDGDGKYTTQAAVVREGIPVSARSIPFKYTVAVYIEKHDIVAVYDPLFYFTPFDYNYD